MEYTSPLIVTAAIIRRGEKLLITKRPDYSRLWEFPGGKMEYGETAEECLKREIKEELDCEIKVGRVFDVSSHVYGGGKHVVIIFYECLAAKGELRALEHEEIKWVSPAELKGYKFVEADMGVVNKLTGARLQRRPY